MTRIEYKRGDILGNYGCQFLYEIEPHISPSRIYRKAMFKCGFCGKEFPAVINDVKRDSPRSCGCYRKISKAKTHLKDITGQKSGRLTAIKRLDKQGPDNSYYWLCKCECGNYKEILISDFRKTMSCGCLCFKSGGEDKMKKILSSCNIQFIEQKQFDNLFGVGHGHLKFDFYLPDYNCCIEVDGRQHHQPIDRFGGINAFNALQQNDDIKNKYCEDNNITLLRIDYNKNKFLNEEILYDWFKEVGVAYNGTN